VSHVVCPPRPRPGVRPSPVRSFRIGPLPLNRHSPELLFFNYIALLPEVSPSPSKPCKNGIASAPRQQRQTRSPFQDSCGRFSYPYRSRSRSSVVAAPCPHFVFWARHNSNGNRTSLPASPHARTHARSTAIDLTLRSIGIRISVSSTPTNPLAASRPLARQRPFRVSKESKPHFYFPAR
jgi:hypothetical protein